MRFFSEKVTSPAYGQRRTCRLATTPLVEPQACSLLQKNQPVGFVDFFFFFFLHFSSYRLRCVRLVQVIKQKKKWFVFTRLKDVRANCLCASLLRTQFMSQRHATSCTSARTKKEIYSQRDGIRCVNLA